MSSNPLEDDPEREARIRKRAHRLWEQDGSPNGREAEFHDRARELIGMEEHPDAALAPNPAAPGAKPPPVEEADIQENLGEFPSLFTDQGDRQTTPAPRKP